MIRLDHVSFHYGGDQTTGEGVDDIDLTIERGQVVVLCGRSGCGKTTLTRLINGLAPHFYNGMLEGAVHVGDLCVSQAELSQVAAHVGSVFQNPKSQFFNLDTTSELAFGCENQAMSRERIHERIEAARVDMRLDALMDRGVFDLSGGEKQQIACGCVYAADPEVLVLDEPSSNLDRAAIRRLHDVLARLKQAGKTVVISEHRLYYLMDLADRFIYMEAGRVTRDLTRQQMEALADDELAAMGLRATSLARLTRPEPHRATTGCADRRDSVDGVGPVRPADSHHALEAVDLACSRGGSLIVDIERLTIPRGAVVAFVGDNGSGKTTLVEALCGVIPSSGSVAVNGAYQTKRSRTRRSFLVMQDVNRQLFAETVIEEALMNASASRERAEAVLERLGLADCAQRHPASLSGGQKQRVAIAGAVCADKEILFYDEPTSGLDRTGMERFATLLEDVRDAGGAQAESAEDACLAGAAGTAGAVGAAGAVGTAGAVGAAGAVGTAGAAGAAGTVHAQVIVTHDPELIMRACTHVLWLERGRVAGFHPLDQDGARRVIRYFTSKTSHHRSTGRRRVSAVDKVLGYAGQQRRRIYAAAAVMTLAAVLSVIPYALIGWLIRRAVEGEPVTLTRAAPALGAVLACLVLHSVLHTWGLSLSHRGAFATLENLRRTLQERLDRQPLGRSQAMGSGAVKKLLTDDIESVELLLAHMIPEGIASTAVPAATVLLMIALDWRLALLTALTVGFGLVAIGQMYAVGIGRMGAYYAARKRFDNTVVEYIQGMAVVRVFNRAHESTRSLEEAVTDYRDLTLGWYRVGWPWMATYGSLFATTTLFTLPLGAWMVLEGSLTLADYVLVVCLGLGIGPPIGRVMELVSALPQVSHKIQTLEKALDHPPLRTGPGVLDHERHDVVFENVRFGYGGDEVLRGVSFTARSGQMTAFVGASGSGKSTIARLIAHHYDADSGRVRVGDRDVQEVSLESLSSHVSYVSQDLFLYDMSILDNIRVGRPQASQEEVLAAAQRARCTFIQELPQGLATRVGTAGARLSGGQRQRIALARAILKDAPVVVLDEATAHIDPQNEALMSAAIAELVRGKTLIVIAHRLDTITRADSVNVLSRGRIVGTGTHAELLEDCPHYQRLWEASRSAVGWTLTGPRSPAPHGEPRPAPPGDLHQEVSGPC